MTQLSDLVGGRFGDPRIAPYRRHTSALAEGGGSLREVRGGVPSGRVCVHLCPPSTPSQAVVRTEQEGVTCWPWQSGRQEWGRPPQGAFSSYRGERGLQGWLPLRTGGWGQGVVAQAT